MNNYHYRKEYYVWYPVYVIYSISTYQVGPGIKLWTWLHLAVSQGQALGGGSNSSNNVVIVLYYRAPEVLRPYGFCAMHYPYATLH